LGIRLGPLAREFGAGKLVDAKFLRGRVIVVDALVTIYQMLAMIRGPDGYFLVDSEGRITSHLVGIFNRECRLLSMGIRSIYVFDGPPHPLKQRILKQRKEEKQKFYHKFIEAVRKGDVENAVKLGKRAMFVTDRMISETKRLLELLGIPYIKAIHDAEAQAAYMVKRNDAFALATRDWDAFLYGSPRMIMHWKITVDDYLPTMLYELREFLEKLHLSMEELIELGILLGTDYNPGGFRGIGPKKAYKLIRTYHSVDRLIELKKIEWRWDISPSDIRKIFVNPPIREKYKIIFEEPRVDELIEFLVYEHNFSKQRVKNQITTAMRGMRRIGRQASILDFQNTNAR